MKRVQTKLEPQKAKMAISNARACSCPRPKKEVKSIPNATIRETTLEDLPVECIASILSFTTLRDVCRLSLVSTAFLSASKSDAAWSRFLPSDLNQIVARSDGGEALLTEFRYKYRQLFMRLVDLPLLVDDASKSFWLEKSGKKCWLFGARSLNIPGRGHPGRWDIPIFLSRFPEAAYVRSTCQLKIGLKIPISTLSTGTRYAAYLVFKTEDEYYGLEDLSKRNVYLMDCSFIDGNIYNDDELPRLRGDGWQELKIGEIFTPLKEDDEDHELEVIWEPNNWNEKQGLIVEGIELRPTILSQKEDE